MHLWLAAIHSFQYRLVQSFLESRLIPFDDHNAIGLFGYNRFGGLRLTMHRIGRQNSTG